MNGIEAGADEARGLAVTFEATPGVAAGVTTAARLAGGGIGAVHRGVHSLSRLLGCDKPPQATPQRFDLSLVRADIDPAVLADRLASSRERHFSLCLLGAPGTGKSALTRYLAERLGLEVVQKRASDLLSKYVGDTEKHIAEAFAEARASGAFLVFDEADSLLADRRLADRNWEVSQVNEMLTWMESHPLPFACTTNLVDHLDPATLRRFVFKITLDYLAPAQAARGVPPLLRTGGPGATGGACHPDARRLLGSSPQGGGAGATGRPAGAGRHAARRVRRQAGRNWRHRLSRRAGVMARICDP